MWYQHIDLHRVDLVLVKITLKRTDLLKGTDCVSHGFLLVFFPRITKTVPFKPRGYFHTCYTLCHLLPL